MVATGGCAGPTPESGGDRLWSIAGDAATHDGAPAGRAGSTDTKSAPPPPGLSAVVDRIVDGDTIVVRIGSITETIRLLGIDTPEKPGGPRPAECFGAEASAYAESLVPAGTAVVLTRDQQTRDQFSRLLAFVHRADDGLFLNLAMLRAGYAAPLFFAPNTSHQRQFESAANAARLEWIGFWAGCGGSEVTLDLDDPPS